MNVLQMMIVKVRISVITPHALKNLVFVLNPTGMCVQKSMIQFVVVMARLTVTIVKEPVLVLAYYTSVNVQCVILLVKMEKNFVVKAVKVKLSVHLAVPENVQCLNAPLKIQTF
jgi:hypothetical protein